MFSQGNHPTKIYKSLQTFCLKAKNFIKHSQGKTQSFRGKDFAVKNEIISHAKCFQTPPVTYGLRAILRTSRNHFASDMISIKNNGNHFACKRISLSSACNRFTNSKMRNNFMPHLKKSFRIFIYIFTIRKDFTLLTHFSLLQGSFPYI